MEQLRLQVVNKKKRSGPFAWLRGSGSQTAPSRPPVGSLRAPTQNQGSGKGAQGGSIAPLVNSSSSVPRELSAVPVQKTTSLPTSFEAQRRPSAEHVSGG